MKEIYVSVDVEADGPCPGLHSMLSFGAVAFDPTRGIDNEAVVDSYSVNLDTLPGAKPDQSTMTWWEKHPEAWVKCRLDPQNPAHAIPSFIAWLEKLPGKPIFVGYPEAYDWVFIYYYIHRFGGGKNPFVRNAIDIETYAMALLGCSYMEAGKRAWPEHWFNRTMKHTHVALEDAMEQGMSFVRMMNSRRSSTWGTGVGGDSGACPVCSQPAGALVDGPHTYMGGCRRRKFQ